MKRALRDYTEFFRQFRETFETTGAIAPSSRFLARAMLGPIRKRGDAPCRILEVGPGTGAVTKSLVKELRQGDVLDLVELNERFVELLNERFQADASFKAVSEFATVHRCAIQDFELSEPYDFIVSGLPLNNFPPALVREILETLMTYVAPGGTISYFEYMYVRDLKKQLLTGDSRKRIRDLDAILREYQKLYRIRRDWIFPNIPPAWVQHLQRPVETTPAP